MTYDLAAIMKVYAGSDGEATKALYRELEALGPIGVVAVNLFRATKASSRAKKYRGGDRGGSYRGQAYGRKEWSLQNLTSVLSEHGERLGIRWGWKVDPSQSVHTQVLYVDLPTGQVSFHAAARGDGPDYPGRWDRMTGHGPGRVCRFAANLIGVPA